jgi:hypothetical protein
MKSLITYKNLVLLGLIALLSVACKPPLSQSDESELDQQSDIKVVYAEETVPASFSAFVPCANGGEGEIVEFTGAEMSIKYRTQSNGREGYVVSGTFNPANKWMGVGQTSGETYQRNQVSNGYFNLNFVELRRAETVETAFHVFGPDEDETPLVYTLNHFRVNSNGEVSVLIEVDRVEC